MVYVGLRLGKIVSVSHLLPSGGEVVSVSYLLPSGEENSERFLPAPLWRGSSERCSGATEPGRTRPAGTR